MGRGIGGLRPPFLKLRTPMRSIGYGALARRVRGKGLLRVTRPLTPTLSPPGRGSAPSMLRRRVLALLRLEPHVDVLFLGIGQHLLDAFLAADARLLVAAERRAQKVLAQDRKSTRLNSSHLGISYAVFC